MKANTETLIKALKACADAHRTEFCDWSTYDSQVAIKSESVPAVSDVRSICEAFFGTTSVVETGWGYTTVYLDETPFLPEVDEETLRLALPSGTTL